MSENNVENLKIIRLSRSDSNLIRDELVDSLKLKILFNIQQREEFEQSGLPLMVESLNKEIQRTREVLEKIQGIFNVQD